MNQAVAEKIKPYLSDQETLLWAGQPHQGLLFHPLDVFMLPLAAFWLAFSFVMAADWLGDPHVSWTALVVIPMAGMGLYLAIGRFFVDRKQRQNTLYAVTSDRVLILSGVFRHRIHSLPLAQLADMAMVEKANGHGTITFGDNFPYAALFGGLAVPTMELYMATQFFQIPDVARVYALLNAAQQRAWSGPSN